MRQPTTVPQTSIFTGDTDSKVDWARLGLWCVLFAPVAAFALTVLFLTEAVRTEPDFHMGIWSAGRDVLNGQSPYLRATPSVLLRHPYSFVTPPPLAIVGIPFSLLPFPIAATIWALLCVAALCIALWVVGVRDPKIYLLALITLPFIDSLENGQPDAMFALGAALAWRYRDSWQGGVAAGAIIAAKLLAWPLVIWLLVTRRFRSAGISVACALALLLGSWALIGFKGLAGYPHLLSADARAFETWRYSYSLVQAIAPLGLSILQTRVVAVLVAIAIAAAIVCAGRRSDHSVFSAALAFGVLSSPFLWPHYLVVLLVPFAIGVGSRRASAWLVAAYGFWLGLVLIDSPHQLAIAMVALTGLLMTAAVVASRGRPSERRSRVPSKRGAFFDRAHVASGIAVASEPTATAPAVSATGATR